MKSYIPGTDANMESRYEQGRDTGRDSSYGRDTGRDFSYGRGNQGEHAVACWRCAVHRVERLITL